MGLITTLDELDHAVRVADDRTRLSVSKMRDHLGSFTFQLDYPQLDPFGEGYREEVVRQYEAVSGRSLGLSNEHTDFDYEAAISRPFPYRAGSPALTADYFIQVFHLLKALDLRSGMVADQGPGWGNTTEILARSGLEVWAIDMNADFIRLANDRLTRQGLGATVLVGDFCTVQDAPILDAAVFFESVHHCLNHLDLIQLLHRKTNDTGVLVFGGEPITKDAGFAWGLRPDGMAVCSVRKFRWLELGFDEDYFLEALLRTGWTPKKFDVPGCLPIYRATKTA